MVSADFAPSLFHPYYFIRKGLYSGISRYAPLMKGKLIDFGCGSKPYRSLFQVDEYVGVDYVNEGHPHENEQIDVFYDGEIIPLPDNTFDSALSSEVFEHVFNLELALRELGRVMKPGGNILITCPFVWKEHEVPNDFARYTHFALKHLFEKSGFKVKVMDKGGNFIEVIFQLQVLFLYDKIYPKVRFIPGVNFLYRLFCIALPNMIGVLLSSFFAKNRTLYLSNIIVAEKC